MIDLHVHLEGTLGPNDLEDLKNSLGISVEPKIWARSLSRMRLFGQKRSLGNFIKALATPALRTLLLAARKDHIPTALVLESVFQKVFEKYTLWGYKKVDLFISPQALSTEAGISERKYLLLLNKVVKENRKIETKIRYCVRREQDAEFPVEKAVSFFKEGLVTGFDIAGDEAKVPLGEFSRFLSRLALKGVPFTAHAGELPPQSSDLAYENLAWAIALGAKRIGHAVRLFDKDERARVLLKKAIQDKIGLEINLTSNVSTGAVTSFAKHPFIKFLNKEKVYPLFAICDDDPAIVGTVKNEFERLAKVLRPEKREKIIRLAKKNAQLLY